MGEYLYRKDTFDKSVVSQTKNEFTNVESSQPKTELSPSESEWEEMITEAEYLRYRKENGRTLTPDQEQKLQFITEMLRQQRREALREFRAANGLSNKQIVANQAETPLETGSKENSNTKEDTDQKNPILESLNYIWGTVIGDWNNQQDPAQILVNTGVGLIPIADQVLDFRDFTAHLYYMVFQKDYQDPMRWLALGLTAVGAIPFVGSIIKGLGKIALFSDATKAIGKSAEPLLQQIRQINPEWADIGKLRAAIEQNWDSGVATSKQVWMNLLASVKSQISGVPLPPDFIWGADKLAGAKQDLLGTISEIQQLSNKMLDDALERIRNEIDIILKELDRIAKEKLGQPELVPEAVGDKVGAYNRTSVEPPQRNEPMLSVGSSSVPPSMKGISSIEFKRLSEIATNRGLKSDLVTNLYDDLGEKAVKDLLTKSDDEIASAMRSVELERIDAGHSVDRHGPQVKDIELENRLKTGIAPDGVFSPAPASTRFSDFDSWVKTRDIALKEIEKKYGIDLSKPPAPGTIGQYDILTEYNRPIDEGFVGDITTKKKVVDPTNPKKKGKAFTSITPVDGITRTKTVIRWDGTAWKTKQHIPWAMDWDDATKTYSQPADSYVTLP